MKISRSIRERWCSKAILIPFAATLAVCILPALASALTCGCDICVNTSGWWRDGGELNGSDTPIQAAVDNATAGETIYVYNGSYSENVNVNKRLTLRGEGAEVVTVTTALVSDHVFNVTADYVNISRFKVTGATGSGNAGIYLIERQHCNISNNNASGNFYGISLRSSSNYNTLTNNTASNNSQPGIYLQVSSNNTLTDNTANSNNNYGIYLHLLSNFNTLVNNTASNNWYGISLSSSSNNTLTDNTANSNDNDGIYLQISSNYNALANNTASDNTQYGIRLNSSTNNQIYNNYFNNTYNVYDDGNNTWNTTPTAGTNIIDGSWLGGNYWSDYAGNDTNGDGLGDNLIPYNSSGNISSGGGDYHPLVADIIPMKVTLSHGGSSGPYVTSTPTVLATEVETAVSVTTEDDDASGVEVDNGTDGSTHVQTEKKGLFVFAIVFAVAGVLAAVYVVIRRRNDQY